MQIEKIINKDFRDIDIEKYKSSSNSKLVLRNLTDEIMYEIHSLSKYGYIDSYVSTIPK